MNQFFVVRSVLGSPISVTKGGDPIMSEGGMEK